MWGQDRIQSLLLRTLKRADSAGVGDVELAFTGQRNHFTRIANNAVFQDSLIHNASVRVRVLHEGALGVTTTNLLDDGGLDAAIERASVAARASSPGTFPGFHAGGDDVAPLPEAYDEQTATLALGVKPGRLAPIFAQARARQLLVAGSFHTRATQVAVANSGGLMRYHRGTSADLRLNGLEGLRPGQATAYGGELRTGYADIDVEGIASRTLDRTEQAKNPKALAPDSYDVLLEPEAVAELVEWLGGIGFSSRSMDDGTSFVSGNIGDKVTGERITLTDDPRAEHGPTIPATFDAEGVRKQARVLLQAGVARGAVTDIEAAHRLEGTSTGHAILGGGMGSGAAPSHLVLGAGTASREELLSTLGTGLWISRLHYVNGMLEPRRAVMTGLTRDGTFWVNNGEVQHAVGDLRFTDSILEAFTRVAAVGAIHRVLPSWRGELSAVTAPALVIRGLRFTGTTTK